MNITITGRHVEVTPAIREYITSKLDRVIRHFDDVTSASVTLSVEKLAQKSAVHLPSKDIFVESSDDSMYAAIDNMVDKLDRQIVKYKEKNGGYNHESIKHQSPEA